MMGMGEPLDNYDNSIRFLHLVGDERGLGIGMRHISLSTSGVVSGIYKLAEENLAITLSISLHAPTDELRNTIMPINKKWNVDTLISACRDYIKATGRRISFEYAVIAGVNDSPKQAKELIGLLGGWMNHLNLIPVNPTKETDFQPADRASMLRFLKLLEQGGINATFRRTLGADIQAACGQLRRNSQKQTQ
jgi:23S rRNA (adenine2503-C2)-methyltransferase